MSKFDKALKILQEISSTPNMSDDKKQKKQDDAVAILGKPKSDEAKQLQEILNKNDPHILDYCALQAPNNISGDYDFLEANLQKIKNEIKSLEQSDNKNNPNMQKLKELYSQENELEIEIAQLKIQEKLIELKNLLLEQDEISINNKRSEILKQSEIIVNKKGQIFNRPVMFDKIATTFACTINKQHAKNISEFINEAKHDQNPQMQNLIERLNDFTNEGTNEQKLILDQENHKLLIDLIDQNINQKDENKAKKDELGLNNTEEKFFMSASGNKSASSFIQSVADKAKENGLSSVNITLGKRAGPLNRCGLDASSTLKIINAQKNGVKINLELSDGPKISRIGQESYKDMHQRIYNHSSAYNKVTKKLINTPKYVANLLYAAVALAPAILTAIPALAGKTRALKALAKPFLKIDNMYDSDKVRRNNSSWYTSSYGRTAENALYLQIQKDKMLFEKNVNQEEKGNELNQKALDAFKAIENGGEISQQRIQDINAAYGNDTNSPHCKESLKIYQRASKRMENNITKAFNNLLSKIPKINKADSSDNKSHSATLERANNAQQRSQESSKSNTMSLTPKPETKG